VETAELVMAEFIRRPHDKTAWFAAVDALMESGLSKTKARDRIHRALFDAGIPQPGIYDNHPTWGARS